MSPSSGPSRLPWSLAPVLAITDRLRTRARLIVLVAVLLVPTLLAAGSFASVIGGELAFVASERVGVQVVRPAVQALAEVAAGRDPDFAAVSTAVGRHPELAADGALRVVLATKGGPRHATALALAALVAKIGDGSKLILDPDLDSYYLMDALVVQLTRAFVAASQPSVEGQGQSAGEVSVRAVRAASLTLATDALRSDVAVATANTRMPGLPAGLIAPLSAVDQLSGFAARITGNLQQPAPDEAAGAAAAAAAGEGAIAPLARMLDELLSRRAAGFADRRTLTLIATLAGLLVAGWLALAVIWRTRRDVVLTLAAVGAISAGDLQPRVMPDGDDEFGDIGRAVHGARDRLERLLFRDPVTGLPNRMLFLGRLQSALDERDEHGLVSVLFLDLDRFKAVNDRLGHAAGDELLRAVAQRIQGCMRADDAAARFGGDEFAVVLRESEPPAARQVAERMVAALRQPFTISGSPVFIGAAIGIAHASGGTRVDADALLVAADLALYSAKALGGGQVCTYEPAMRTARQERLDLGAELQNALGRGELEVHYQPVVRLDTGATIGFEALLRWNRPTAEQVGPEVFVPLAEATGLIVDFGRWVLHQACEQLAGWRREAPTLTVNVNVSAYQLRDPAFVRDVEGVLDRNGLPGSALTLEITESMLMLDQDRILERLYALTALGVLIAVDDFGTGYSCLGYLQQLPVDILKIDRSFVSGATGRRSEQLLRTIIDLGRALGLSVVAEGIETAEQWAQLRRLGCTEGQGYYFGRPLDRASATEHLALVPRGPQPVSRSGR